jgi:electron transfer flavoprotein alpha subunit
VLYVDDPALAEFTPDAYVAAWEHVIRANAPRATILGDTSIGADVAGRLSVRLDLPLVSRCAEVGVDGAVAFRSQICGGKIIAEGLIPEPSALVTFIPGAYKVEAGRAAVPPPIAKEAPPALGARRVELVKYVEPEAGDVDITKQTILVAVGRGIQQEANIEMADELAGLLGAEVCASRPVVDQGWLPTSRLVGKSGQHVTPKLYLALGISGAPEHAEGMRDSQMIVAVNTDSAAPIFDIAQFGTTADMFDLLPVLAEQLRQAKGG